MDEIEREGGGESMDWERARPLLDEAIGDLGEDDRAAICLRYFDELSFSEIGERLNASADASRMRVNRALERLNERLGGRGIRSSAVALGVAVSGQAALSAPVGLAGTIVEVASLGTSVTSTGSLWHGLATLMKTTKATVGWTSALAACAVGTVWYQLERLEGVRADLSELRAMQRTADSLDSEIDSLRLQLETQDEDNRSIAGSSNIEETAFHGFTQLEMEAALESWVTRVTQLIDFASLYPELRIPEMDMLESSDWLDVVEGDELKTVADYRLVLARLRQKGKQKMTQPLAKAFRAYLEASDGAMPERATDLYEYSEKSFDPAILERYDVGTLGQYYPNRRSPNSKLLYEARPADPIWEDDFYVGPRISAGSSSHPGGRKWRSVETALETFEKEKGRLPVDSSELTDFVSLEDDSGKLEFNTDRYEEIFAAMTTLVDFDEK